ncbi:hypothetical protein PDJAM_G00069290 [Pangasius djambal]|uniref:Uncharacterized protein n=1 Tax=Pangasius djambal TaxID=1691987 RepID=A0ACC5Z093_9TELE|nr:hypothetical protein [Pangasius djambal]
MRRSRLGLRGPCARGVRAVVRMRKSHRRSVGDGYEQQRVFRMRSLRTLGEELPQCGAWPWAGQRSRERSVLLPVRRAGTHRPRLRTDRGRCGEIGHVAVQCSKASEVNCYNCGKTGHLARECTIEASACGEIGHVAVQCSKASEVNCYNCGKTGHLARECTIEASA